ncbi:MAG: hypothetical protein OHK93_006044 [Ramalina farinacea]|uniref:Dynactin subunit 4 n=1 Tax=Ramalina farinacea TaxID=258253 RepID=A0AA43TSM9_9LECA|nr:hypothetical protein [Ramalina farinacea]
MEFERINNIHIQIQKIADERQQQQAKRTHPSETDAPTHPPSGQHAGDTADTTFTSLQSFYKAQLAATEPKDPLLTPSGGFNYSSPSNLARLMSLYTGRGGYGKKDPSRSNTMREACDPSEGLRIFDPTADTTAIERLRTEGWRATTSPAQQSEQRHHPVRFVDELRPLPPYLRTKRSKRCATCRHILVKPEPKPQSTRYRIKLVAMNYVPTMTLKPLQPAAAAAASQQGRAGAGSSLVDLKSLRPLRPTQTLLTLKNPLFDPVRISLATPAVTRGRFKHKITILCPEFEVGANLDQWDEALADPDAGKVSKHLNLEKVEFAGGEGGRVAEAGKVWERGRNWTSVVVEVVCADVWGEMLGGKGDELEEGGMCLRYPFS